MTASFDSIVAGAGIWGCTVARRLAEAGKRVLVLEKRAAVGGNCRCETDPETGIEVHAYGSHIFHTGNEEVWTFVNRFVRFNDYRHCVLAKTKMCGKEREAGEDGRTADGFRLYHLPIGCTLLEEFFGRKMMPCEMTERERVKVFDAFIRGYTSKQWGVPPEEVDPAVISRLKVRNTFSTDYFDDPHQGIPLEGYNRMFERMLDHPNVTVHCKCELALEAGEVRIRGQGQEWLNPLLSNQTIFHSGPVDAFFNYRFGALPWRTLNFERETLDLSDYQGNSVVNYPDVDVPWTRIHEFKHYHPEGRAVGSGERVGREGRDWGARAGKTVIMREYSAAWQLGDEPYYPVGTPESAALLRRYQEEAEAFNHRGPSATTLILGGRLGLHRYLDMDKAIESALRVTEATG